MAKAAATTTTISILPSFLLLLLILDNNCNHDAFVLAFFSPSASLRLATRDIGDNNDLPCRAMVVARGSRRRRSQSRSRSIPTVLLRPRGLSSSSSSSLSSSLSSTKILESLSDNRATETNEMKSLGEKLILQAALQCGATEPMMCIEWKADRIIVTVDVSKDETYVERDDDGVTDGDNDEFDDDDADNDIMPDFLDEGGEVMMYDDEVEIDADDDMDDSINDPRDEVESSQSESTFLFESEFNNNRIDLSRIARTINELLARDGEDSISYTIAKLHEIEVTTPEFDNVLRGKRMFESYKGFDVTVKYWEEEEKKTKAKRVKSKSQKDSSSCDDDSDEEGDNGDKDTIPDKRKLKIAEGKLVGRDYEKEVTLINIKGRVTKIRNDMIERVCLPKAKREKGIR